ncbi:MAG: 16S rRNA (cytosine(1402)-N(4))-methyltransferase RsmH [Phycisphaeraceae bacterium]|nr:16S rRNA (cytosine(1402)-N(4))-methyltransferase RsmH [Phycisphaeraceae bacterium]
MGELSHIPVLSREVAEVLALRPGETYADCTAGRGGHAALLAPLTQPGGRVVLNDADASNLEFAASIVSRRTPEAEIRRFQGNFALLPREMESKGIRADAVLADFGFSSTQIEEADRGFSFMRSGRLDMRFDVSRGLSAADLVNTASERELARILRDFGEEPAFARIARAIVDARKTTTIATTDALADIIRGVAGKRPGSGMDPATKSFQALRIAVNDEIGSIEALLAQIARAARSVSGKGVGGLDGPGGVDRLWLKKGARIALITFHSLEDRPVKTMFADMCKEGLATDLARGGITASDEEVRANPRARSARLRAIKLSA